MRPNLRGYSDRGNWLPAGVLEHHAFALTDTPAPKPPDESYVSFLRQNGANTSVKTIILTDRLGDLASGPLTDEAVSKLLGPGWKLVGEEEYNWYYEWRFYFFNTWRTRVWVRP